MERENFETIEGLCEDLSASCSAIEEWLDNINPRTRNETSAANCILHEISNVRLFKNRIYSVCDSDDTGEATINEDSELFELYHMLPNRFSLGEWESLKEHINKWREENGYPQYCE